MIEATTNTKFLGNWLDAKELYRLAMCAKWLEVARGWVLHFRCWSPRLKQAIREKRVETLHLDFPRHARMRSLAAALQKSGPHPKLRSIGFSSPESRSVRLFAQVCATPGLLPALQHIRLKGMQNSGDLLSHPPLAKEAGWPPLEVLGQPGVLPALERLDLAGNELTDKNVQILAQALSCYRTLRSLNLKNNKIGPRGETTQLHSLPTRSVLTTVCHYWQVCVHWLEHWVRLLSP